MIDKNDSQIPFKVVTSKFLPGYAYGIREKSVIYRFSINLNCIKDNIHISQFASDAVEENENDIEEQILILFDHVVGLFQDIQRSSRIPVFSRPVRVFKGNIEGEMHIIYALPYWEVNTLLKVVFMTLEYLNDLVNMKVAYCLWKNKIARFFNTQLAKVLLPVRESKSSNEFALVESAFKKKMEVSLLSGDGILQLGYSVSAPWLRTTHTSNTLFLSASLSQDKFSTNRLLYRFGFPVCRQEPVRNSNEFESACQKIGFPLVVKPRDCDGGAGISSNLTDLESAEKAYRLARKKSKNVLLEGYVSGDDVRIIFFEGRLLKCFKRKKQGVFGDGKLSIRDLVSQKNASVRKKTMQLEIDNVANKLLEQQHLSLQSIPAQGEYVKLGELHNVSAGGIMVPLSAVDIHPDNIKLAKKAVEVLRLDFGGVDMITDNIKKSWRETNLAITEINSAPQIGSEDKVVFNTIIDILTANVEIPTVDLVITLDFDESNKLAYGNDLMQGVAVVFNGQVLALEEMIAKQFQDTFFAVRAVAQQPGVVKILMYMTVGEVRKKGLPFITFNSIMLTNAVKVSDGLRSLLQFIGSPVD